MLEKHRALIVPALSLGCLLLFAAACQADAPLQGEVQQAETLPDPEDLAPMEPMVAPVPKQPLQGGVEQSGLQGGAQGTSLTGGADAGGWAGNMQQGALDQSAPLQGGASQNPLATGVFNDPDASDQELQIEWDRWRNTLMQAIQAGTLAKINVQNDVNFVFDPARNMMMPRYAPGTSAWYSIDVLPDRRIVNVKLTGLSGNQNYDQAVLQAINDLQRNPILTYPRGSKRQTVTQEGNVKTAGQTQFQNFQHGDVERQRF